MFVYDVILTP